MRVWFHRKVHMTFVIITFYIFMYPVIATNQRAILDLKKPSFPFIEDKISSLRFGYHNATGVAGSPKETDLFQPLQRNVAPLSDNMKDLINFIDVRARDKSLRSKNIEESKVIVDLDQTKVDLLGEMPKEATFFTKKVIEEGVIVDIPKSSLIRVKRSNSPKYWKKKKMPYEMRLFYKTSTPVFRPHQRYFRTTKLVRKVYKAVLSPFKKIKMHMRHKNHKLKYNKRSQDYLKPTGLLNTGEKYIPKICHASHYTYHHPIGYLKKFKKITTRSLPAPLKKLGHESTIHSLQASKKNSEISEAALFQIINKLIQDSTKNKSIDSLEVNMPTERSVFNMTGIIQASHRRTKKKGSRLSRTTNPDFNLAVIIAKITHEGEDNSTTTVTAKPLPSQKSRNIERTGSVSTFAKNRVTVSKPLHDAGIKIREKYQEPSTDNTNTSDFRTDKCRIDKIHTSTSSGLAQAEAQAQQPSTLGLHSLLKEIIKHVSIALDAVTTSKEFLELISCETGTSKPNATGETQPGSTTYTTTKNEFPLVECSDEDKKNWLKTKDNCFKTDMTIPTSSTTQLQNNLTQEVSTREYSTQGSIVDSSSLQNNLSTVSSVNINCENIQTTTDCTIFLDDEEEYFEALNITGYDNLLNLPEDGDMVEDYQTASYTVKRSNIQSSLKRKRNRKNNMNIGVDNINGSGVYDARELIKELENYHLMLKDPIVTEIWRFFEVSTRESTSQIARYSPVKLKKSKLSNLNFNEHKSDLKYLKRKVNSITENTLDKLNSSDKSIMTGLDTKKLGLANLFKISDPGNTRGVREQVRVNGNYSCGVPSTGFNRG